MDLEAWVGKSVHTQARLLIAFSGWANISTIVAETAREPIRDRAHQIHANIQPSWRAAFDPLTVPWEVCRGFG